MTDRLRLALTSAATAEYERPGARYYPGALPLLLGAVEDIVAAVEGGLPVAVAIDTYATGAFAKRLHRAAAKVR